MTIRFSTWIDSLVPVATSLNANDKLAVVTDAPDARSISRDNLARSIYSTVLTTDGDIITRQGGEPARITRSGLANDSAFTGKYVPFATLTVDGDLYTRTGGVVTRITRTDLANDSAFTNKYLDAVTASSTYAPLTRSVSVAGTGLSGGGDLSTDITISLDPSVLSADSSFTGAFAPRTIDVSTQTSNYTFVLGDQNKLVIGNSASTVTFTVPPNSSVPFPVGAKIDLWQQGVGSVTVASGSGVTVNSTDSKLSTSSRYSPATLVKVSTDGWLLVGDLA